MEVTEESDLPHNLFFQSLKDHVVANMSREAFKEKVKKAVPGQGGSVTQKEKNERCLSVPFIVGSSCTSTSGARRAIYTNRCWYCTAKSKEREKSGKDKKKKSQGHGGKIQGKRIWRVA